MFVCFSVSFSFSFFFSFLSFFFFPLMTFLCGIPGSANKTRLIEIYSIYNAQVPTRIQG